MLIATINQNIRWPRPINRRMSTCADACEAVVSYGFESSMLICQWNVLMARPHNGAIDFELREILLIRACVAYNGKPARRACAAEPCWRSRAIGLSARRIERCQPFPLNYQIT